ncbi:MAG: hypothetical protein ABI321_24430 [Polyangia bacterium]
MGLSFLWGIGGLVVGAGIVAALTPFTGMQLRNLVKELVKKDDANEESDGKQLDRMSGEGGIAHEVPATTSTKGFESHS